MNRLPALSQIEERFRVLYGKRAGACTRRLNMLIGRYGVGSDQTGPAPAPDALTQRDMVLITYADMVSDGESAPLRVLNDWLHDALPRTLNTVHLLPFYPYSSDDGFSVIDYRVVDPAVGTWEDVERLGRRYRLAFDLVINHVSRQSSWFRDYVNGIAPARDFFIEMDPATDLSAVTRPRTSPLLTETLTREGSRWVWTTFSADQVDVNFANPDVFFEFLDILFLYVSRGVRIIRLDAIAYLWKTVGTSCIHLPETHEVVKLIRDIFALVAPRLRILTETNVPHIENISYFGDGDEAHMVYQFGLPPLVAQGLTAGTACYLTRWAQGLPTLSPGQSFFNFTASHDGVGVRPLQGLVPDEAFDAFVEYATNAGAQVSRKKNSDGSESPYELNVTYFDLFSDGPGPVTEKQVAQFLSSQAIMLALRGVPGIYFNSLFGARNYIEGVKKTGHARTINRQKWDRAKLDRVLNDPPHHMARVFKAYTKLLRIRREQTAFDPDGPQQVLSCGAPFFVLKRTPPNDSSPLFSVTNFSGEPRSLPREKLGKNAWHDLIADEILTGEISLAPWQTRWLIHAAS